jgi:hypothetical protein
LRLKVLRDHGREEAVCIRTDCQLADGRSAKGGETSADSKRSALEEQLGYKSVVGRTLSKKVLACSQ